MGNRPPLLDITALPHKGRSFLLNEDVSAGDVVLRTKPYAAIPDCGSRTFVCAHCLKPPKITHQEQSHSASPERERQPLPVSCVTCCVASYCTSTCADRDFLKFHRFECAFLAELGATTKNDDDGALTEYERDYLWLLVRVLIGRAWEVKGEEHDVKDDTSAREAEETMRFEDVWALCSNASSFSAEAVKRFHVVAGHLLHFVQGHLLPGFKFPSDVEDSLLWAPETQDVPNPKSPPPNAAASNSPQHSALYKSLLTLICKEECNSFGLYTFAYQGPTVPRQGYALALYPRAVFFNHSCLPNVGHITNTCLESSAGTVKASGGQEKMVDYTELIFYATRDIKRGDEAVISYIELDEADTDAAGDGEGRSAVERRRMALNDMFFFKCACVRCEFEADATTPPRTLTDLSALLCRKDGCRGRFMPSALAGSHEPEPATEGTKGGLTKASPAITEDPSPARTDSAKDLRLKTAHARKHGPSRQTWTCEACGRIRQNA
ncbi:uncharacterized protein EV422DRAFT_295821 [Fimicolochytrium jonesii]|uniref:uncharacterized protein n=1 Tax=Fimicolochytrium jonesii TaxID=1396493 RepID=UPI0022FE46D4|nr:uncharacterized protein EV422DRAFT_295821 [Fimicolochytrium jonesii]KAI8816306.1 hypothetical protein EV422DRAFT_295821 [Fimicolochytrium jonesii]